MGDIYMIKMMATNYNQVKFSYYHITYLQNDDMNKQLMNIIQEFVFDKGILI